MDTTLLIAIALVVSIVAVLLVLVAIIIYQRWRIGDQNVFIERFIHQNEDEDDGVRHLVRHTSLYTHDSIRTRIKTILNIHASGVRNVYTRFH